MAEPQRSYYAIIPANVRYDPELPANAKLLYGEITALCNERGYCWASNQYFAELYNTTTRTIRRWVSQLAERGHIQCEMQFDAETNATEYRRITLGGGGADKNVLPPGQKCPNPPDKNVLPPGDKNVLHNITSSNTTENNISFSLSRAREEQSYDVDRMIQRVREQVKAFGI